MVFRSLLLVLLVLACLQSFAWAESDNGPEICCFGYQKSPIPVKRIAAYEETSIWCMKPGVIFTLKSGREVCAHPEDEWVKRVRKTIDQREFTILY